MICGCRLPSYCRIKFLSKLFGKCMYSRLNSFLTKYHVLFKYHFGVRNNNLINPVLVIFLELIKKYSCSDYFICDVFIDLQKAIDSVNHDIPFAELEHCGVLWQANNCLQIFSYKQITICAYVWVLLWRKSVL